METVMIKRWKTTQFLQIIFGKKKNHIGGKTQTSVDILKLHLEITLTVQKLLGDDGNNSTSSLNLGDLPPQVRLRCEGTSLD